MLCWFCYSYETKWLIFFAADTLPQLVSTTDSFQFSSPLHTTSASSGNADKINSNPQQLLLKANISNNITEPSSPLSNPLCIGLDASNISAKDTSNLSIMNNTTDSVEMDLQLSQSYVSDTSISTSHVELNSEVLNSADHSLTLNNLKTNVPNNSPKLNVCGNGDPPKNTTESLVGKEETKSTVTPAASTTTSSNNTAKQAVNNGGDDSPPPSTPSLFKLPQDKSNDSSSSHENSSENLPVP